EKSASDKSQCGAAVPTCGKRRLRAPPMVTRDTGALNEDLESEFVRIGKPWLCTATKGHALRRSSWSGNLRRRHTRAAHAKVNAIPNFRIRSPRSSTISVHV